MIEGSGPHLAGSAPAGVIYDWTIGGGLASGTREVTTARQSAPARSLSFIHPNGRWRLQQDIVSSFATTNTHSAGKSIALPRGAD
jgi:hypothetical protein